MGDGGAPLGRAAELLFLHRLPRPVAVALLVVVGGACIVLGVAALDVQRHFIAAGGPGRLDALLAQGSTALTAWEGWAAAGFFLVAVLRLRRGAPEPPAGRRAVEALSIAALRAGLVREYTVVRVGLVALYVVGLVDATRALRYALAAAAGDTVAAGSLPATLVEAAGLVAAAAVLTVWALSFREQLRRVGAVP